jgi:hypothetical protein
MSGYTQTTDQSPFIVMAPDKNNLEIAQLLEHVGKTLKSKMQNSN